MPRRVQDIVPADRRSIRDVSIDRTSPAPDQKRSRKAVGGDVRPIREKTEQPEKDKDKEVELPIHRAHEHSRRMPVTPPTPPVRSRSNKRKKGMWLVVTLGIIVVIAVAGYVASTHFARASFVITPKVIPVSVNGTYVAQAAPGNGGLTYEIVTLKGAASTTIPATSGPQVSTKAAGTVTVYNSYSGQSAKLIAGTRLSDGSGRIYRLTSTVVIPGYTKPGSSIMPGHVMAQIVADQPGDSYNIGSADTVSDFKIVAYQGTPRYDSIYARLASDISGGFVGTKKIINPSLQASTTAILRARLAAALFEQIRNTVPAGYMLYDGSYAPMFSPPLIDGSNPNSASITQQGVVYGFIFKKDDLVRAFAGSQAVTAFGSFDYSAPGLDTLAFSIANLKDYSPDKKTSLVIHAKGSLKLVGTIPINEIKQKLAGISLAETQDIFKSYSPVIESGTGELVPPWAKVPKDPSHISVTVQDQ